MYIEITNMCNMRCRHCGMDAKPAGKGIHMSEEDFDQCLSMACRDCECSVTVGGGEPTIHPRFRRFWKKLIDLTVESLVSTRRPSFSLYPQLITNGTRYRNFSYALQQIEHYHDIGYRIKDRVYLAVSTDVFHDRDMQDDRIIGWVQKNRGLRSHGPSYQTVMSIGRAKRNGLGTTDSADCFCDDLNVKPNGVVHACGCPDAPAIGHIRDLCSTYPNLTARDLPALLPSSYYFKNDDDDDDSGSFHRKWRPDALNLSLQALSLV